MWKKLVVFGQLHKSNKFKLSDFRNSVSSNTLIATSIAEEGIDVDVDLITYFGISTKNPKKVQRIGRTGRKRHGNVIGLVTEGKEHGVAKEVLATEDRTNQKIARSKDIQQILYKMSPRMVPPEFDPKCVQTFIRVSCEETESNETDKTKKHRKKPNSISNDNTDVETSEKKARENSSNKVVSQSNRNADVRNFFKKIELSGAEKEIFDVVSNGKEHYTRSSVNSVDSFSDNYDSNRTEVKLKNVDIDKQIGNITRNQCQSLIRKLNNLSRRLHNPPADYELLKEPIDALNSENLSKLGKRLYLVQNFIYLKDKFETIRAIEAIIDIQTDEIKNEVADLKEEYEFIQNIFNGITQVLRCLEKYNRNYYLNTSKVLNKKFPSLFDGLQKRSYFDNVKKFLDEKLEEIKLNEKNKYCEIGLDEITKDFTFCDDNFSIRHSSNLELADNEESHINIFDYSGSKYCSQWTQFKNQENKKQSTPLRNISARESGDDNRAEINEDLFDDDFNEILVTSSNILLEVENQTNNKKKEVTKNNEKNSHDIILSSMINTIHDTKSIRNNIPESCLLKKSHTSNPEIEGKKNTFENEELLHKKNNVNMNVRNMLGEIKCVMNCKAENIFKKENQVLFNSTDQNKNIQKVESFDVIQKQEEILSGNRTFLNQKIISKSVSPEKSSNTSPSVFRNKVNSSKLKQFSSESTALHTGNRYALNNENISFFLNRSKKYGNITGESKEDRENGFDEIIIRNLNKNKRRIESSESSLEESEEKVIENIQRENYKSRGLNYKKIKRKRCVFFNNEADCSGSDIDEDSDDETNAEYVLDSIVVDDFEESPLTTTMKAKYLQSVRSPHKGPAAFRIPKSRDYPTLSQIYSQAIDEDDDLNTYKEDSFVVTDEEDIAECEINEICPLERAEAILQAKRKGNKKYAQNKLTRIISRCTESSDEDK